MMADTVRTQFRLDKDAYEILNTRADSENRRGQWLSRAIREYATLLDVQEVQDEQCHGTLEGIAATLARIEQRLVRIESKVG